MTSIQQWTEHRVCKQIVDSLLGSKTTLFDKSLSDEEILDSLCSRPHTAADTHTYNTHTNSHTGNITYFDTITLTESRRPNNYNIINNINSCNNSYNTRLVRRIPTIFHLSLSTYDIELQYNSSTSSSNDDSNSDKKQNKNKKDEFLSNESLQSILRWFVRLSSHIHLCRLWSSALTDKYLQRQRREKRESHLEAVAALQSSIHELIVALEQELCVVDARIAGLQSVFEKNSPLLAHNYSYESNNVVSEKNRSGYNQQQQGPSKITLLMLYQRMRKWESLFHSMSHRILLIADIIDLQLPVENQSDTTLSQAKVAKEDTKGFFETAVLPKKVLLSMTDNNCLIGNDATFFYCFGILRDFEILLKQGSCVEVMTNIPTVQSNAGQRGNQLSLRLHLPLLDNNSTYMFTRKAFIRYLEKLLEMIMKRIWATDSHANHMNSLQKDTKTEDKVAADRVVIHELCGILGKDSFLSPLLHEIDCSLEDFEILSKFKTARLRNNLAASKHYKFSKVNFLNMIKDKAESLIDSVSEPDTEQRSIRSNNIKEWLLRMKPLDGFLNCGKLRDLLQTYFVNNNNDFDHARQSVEIKEFYVELKELRDLQASSESKCTASEESALRNQLWKNSTQAFSSAVLDEFLLVVEDVMNGRGNDDEHTTNKEREESNERSTSRKLFFIPFFLHLHQSMLHPLRQELISVKKEAMLLLQQDFLLCDHILLLKNVFLLGKLDVFMYMRELAMNLVYFLSDHLESLDLLRSNRTGLFNSLRHSITVAIEECTPKRGLQYMSLFLPSFQEALHIRGFDDLGMVSQRMSNLTSTERDIDESMYELLFKQIKVDFHYQWPLSIIMCPDVMSRFQVIQRFLLAMTCSKWLSEFWWKAIVARGGLFHVQSSRTSKQQTARQQQSSVSLTPEEEDILRSKRICQFGLTTFSHTMNTLHGFYLTTIHCNIWKEFEEKFLHTQESVLLLKHGLQEVLVSIELCISLFKDNIVGLQTKCFKAFHDLRFAMTSEYRQDNRSSVLISYHLAEVSFQHVLEANEQLIASIRDTYTSKMMKLHLSVDQIKAVEELQYLL